MRTSAHQYDLIVTYMEQHGDITKPLSNNAQGKLRALQKWAELQHILNADGSGDSKTIDKWKKVWADLKNNTKKKAARIHKSVCGTGGGPATTLKLTPLEERVLNIIGVQVATGLALQEAGLTQFTVSLSLNFLGNMSLNWSEWSPIQITTAPYAETVSPIRSNHRLQPDRSGQTTPRRGRQTRNRWTPRRPLRPVSRADQATLNFLHSDEEWRKFKIEQQKENLLLKKEQLRIRELEVQANLGWQNLASSALNLLREYLNKK
ncbi:hypothetical protein ABMA28_012460 [Loxostege sticticalis]|uniref:Regulatory protein zeste n=1 Tax=Loxostege sticticalis TaxID=481309 RepID=A0ABD0S3X4_LOXSC